MAMATYALPIFDRLLDDVMTGMAGTSLGTHSHAAVRSFSPAIDVRANGEEIVFTADVPGFKQEDLEVTFEKSVLSLKGQRRYEGNGKDKVWLGRSYGSFERTFTLPETADGENLTANLADGVLTIRVAQVPKAQPKKITIGINNGAPKLASPDET